MEMLLFGGHDRNISCVGRDVCMCLLSTIASKINITPVWLYFSSECPRTVDAPVVAGGLPVQADRASRERVSAFTTDIQPVR